MPALRLRRLAEALVTLSLIGGGAAEAVTRVTDNDFNPAISLILDGQFAAYSDDPGSYHIPGFPLGGEAGLDEEGFSLSESELSISGNIDDRFYGSFTGAFHSHDGETEVDMEEAYIETMGLGQGFTVKAGRFFSGFGYLNERHPHQWDFTDTALPYRALLGRTYGDDGVQLRWIAPTTTFVELGGEYLRGQGYPAGGAAHDGTGAQTAFLRIGGDLGASHSWRVGASHLWARAADRAVAGSHAHEDEHKDEAGPVFDGDVRVAGVDVVWKWAPQGNPSVRHTTFQAEYLRRSEEGQVAVEEGAEQSDYDGTQSGWYAQGVYQFMPRWRAGLRYDRLHADNTGSDADVLAEAGLDDAGHDPKRWSVMVDYNRSEFSRIRLQYNRDESSPDGDDQWFLQYLMSLGAHGAHKF